MVGLSAEDQVKNLIDKFKDLKEDFDRCVDVQNLETLDIVQEAVDAVRDLLTTVGKSLTQVFGLHVA